MKKTIIAAGFSLLPFVLPLEARATTFSKMYVFGDSLSDPGNIYNATKFVQPFEPFFGVDIPVLPPSPPYYEGHYSNGPIWVDYLAEDMGLTLTPSTELSKIFSNSSFSSPVTVNASFEPRVSPFFQGATTDESVNFAFGGAQTGFTGSSEFGELIPGVQTQVGWFADDLGLSNQSADPEALYILWAGPNDYWSVANPHPEESVTNLGVALNSLYNLGARNFLVPNLPDLGKTAGPLSEGPEESNRLTNLTEEHNLLLQQTLSDFSQSFTDVNLVSLDVYNLFNNAINNPEEFGLKNVTQPCWDEVNLLSCANPDEYLFWDDIHPTSFTHQRLAEFALTALMPEPEPVFAPAGLKSQPMILATSKSESESTSVPEPTPVAALGLLGLLWLQKKARGKMVN